MKSYRIFFVTIITFFSLTISFADNLPLYDNGILTLPSVDSPDKPGEYQDATFEYTEQDGWQLLGFKNGRLLNILTEVSTGIENVEIIKTDTFPTQVFLKVTVTLLNESLMGQIRYKLTGNMFEVFMYYSNTPCVCTSNIGMTFAKIIPLNIYSLKKGDYEYSVNGNFTGSFSLAEDNEL